MTGLSGAVTRVEFLILSMLTVESSRSPPRRFSSQGFDVIAGTRYDSIDTAGAMPSFLARRANLRSSNVATLSQTL